MTATEPFTSASNESVNMDTSATASAPPELSAYMSPTQRAAAAVAGENTAAAEPVALRPRTRWAAVVWGLFFLATAVTALWIMLDDDRRAVAGSWIGGLNPWSAIAYLGLAVGVLLLVGGTAGLIRRAQRQARDASGPAGAANESAHEHRRTAPLR